MGVGRHQHRVCGQSVADSRPAAIRTESISDHPGEAMKERYSKAKMTTLACAMLLVSFAGAAEEPGRRPQATPPSSSTKTSRPSSRG